MGTEGRNGPRLPDGSLCADACVDSAAVGEMMAAVVYAEDLEASPYVHLLAPERVEEVARLFVRERCRVEQLSLESPLETLYVGRKKGAYRCARVCVRVCKRFCVFARGF